MKENDKDFDNLRKETALRVEQAGYNSNHFSFEKIGDEDHPAIVIGQSHYKIESNVICMHNLLRSAK